MLLHNMSAQQSKEMSKSQKPKAKTPKLKIVEAENPVEKEENKVETQPPVKNRGTGAGGAKTNENGLSYEEKTDLKDRYNVVKPINKNINIVKFPESSKEYIVTKQNGFNKYLSTKIRSDIKPVHGAKRPDEVFIDEDNKVLFILEKKFQQVNGSKCECIQTYLLKIRNYKRRIPNYKIVYIYCLSEWFKTNCEAEIEDLDEDKIPYFWGSSETYKDDIINFILNYK